MLKTFSKVQITLKNRVHRKQLNNIRKHRPAVLRLKGFQLALRFMHCPIESEWDKFVRCGSWGLYTFLTRFLWLAWCQHTARRGNWFSTARAIWRNSISLARIQKVHRSRSCTSCCCAARRERYCNFWWRPLDKWCSRHQHLVFSARNLKRRSTQKWFPLPPLACQRDSFVRGASTFYYIRAHSFIQSVSFVTNVLRYVVTRLHPV